MHHALPVYVPITVIQLFIDDTGDPRSDLVSSSGGWIEQEDLDDIPYPPVSQTEIESFDEPPRPEGKPALP